MPEKSTSRTTRREDKQYYRNCIAHLWQDTQGLPTHGTLLINIMKDHNYGPLSNSTYVDAPTVKSQRPTSLKRRLLCRGLTLTSKKAPSNTYQWTSSQISPKVRSMIASLQLSIKDAPK